MNSKTPSRYKLQTRWKITGTLTTQSPMHIGNGETVNYPLLASPANSESNECAAFERDRCGNPIIPGSALKGVLRAWADQHYSAQATAIARIFGDDVDGSAKDARAGFAEFCHATLIAPSSDQLDRFTQYLPYWSSDRRTGVLTHVCIDRFNGTAINRKLFFEEFLPEGMSFQVTIFAERLMDADIQLLLAILEHGSTHDTAPLQFGANGADGWGRVSWEEGCIERADSTNVTFDAASISFRQTWLQAELTPLAAPTSPSAVRTIPVSLQCRGAFLVNDTSRTHRVENDGLPNFTPLRRADGGVWLPASSFRGALRQRAEFILRSLDPTATGDPNQPLQDNGAIEHIFGTTGRVSRLAIKEFTEVNRSSEHCQDFVAIDRFTGGAADGAKFLARYADRPTVESRLDLNTQGLSDAELALFAAALRDAMRGDVCFGFGGSKGYGEFRGTWDAESEKWAEEQLKHLPSTKLISAPTVTPSAAFPANSKTIEGKLIYQQVKGKPVRRIIYRNKKNEWTTKAPTPFDETLLPASLRSNPSPEIDIDFEWESPNRPYKIREHGQQMAITAKHTVTAEQAQGKFAHAYYFLRQEERKSDWPHDLADREPVGHDRYREGYFSGTIRVRLTTETPLLICDDTARRETSQGHFEYDMRVDADSRPVLQPSSVRGMLRAAYEAITNSRFGVFPGRLAAENRPAEKQGRRLGFRLPAQRGLVSVPARIIRRPSGELAVQLLAGTSAIQVSSNTNPINPVYAAWCGHYGSAVPTGVSGHGHRAEVWAYLTPWHYSKLIRNTTIAFDFWNVEDIQPTSPVKPATTPSQRTSSSQNATIASEGASDWYKGYLCVTLNNMNGKHDERFFFDPNESNPTPTAITVADLTEPVLNQWRELIQDYHDQHRRDIINGSTRPPILKSSKYVFSRHISVAPRTVNELESELNEGDLCYAEVSGSTGNWQVEALYPVMISRKLYPCSPLARLPKTLRPAPDRSRLSPADRVFGWVSQAGPSQENPAYRSQLRVGVIECKTENAVMPLPLPLVLPILAQPKPAQGRFYLGDQAGRTQPNGGTKEERGYTETRRIRGPKAYPHHTKFSLDELRQLNVQESKQNRSITGYVEKRTEFVFELHLLNVSRTELAALVWLLSLPEGHFLRLGLGKPLGFGSVRVTVDSTGTCVADGKDWIARLGNWDTEPQGIDLPPLVTEYESIMSSVNSSLLPSFLQIAKGFGKVDVKYPPNPNDPNGIGNHFEWFVANEQRQNDAVSLPDPNDAAPLLSTNPGNA